jgi:hypothetical protein
MRHVWICADAAVVRMVLAWVHLAAAQMLRLQRGITYERRTAAFQGRVSGAPRLPRACAGGRCRSGKTLNARWRPSFLRCCPRICEGHLASWAKRASKPGLPHFLMSTRYILYQSLWTRIQGFKFTFKLYQSLLIFAIRNVSRIVSSLFEQ